MPRLSDAGTSAATSRAGASQSSTDGRNDGARGEPGQGVVERLLGGVRQPAAEVRRLHRPRPAAGGDDGVRAERPAQPGGVGVVLLAPLHGVAAHDADQVPLAPPLVERLVDRVVVECGDQGVVGAGRPLGPGVGAGVERVAVVRRVVELGRGVEPGAMDVERRVTDHRQHERAGRRQPLGVAPREGAAEEHRTGHPATQQPVGVAGQVEAPHLPATQRPRPGVEASVEVGRRLDVDDAAPGALHARNVAGGSNSPASR